MKIDIDGIIFSLQRSGGISVYFHQLISYLTSKTSYEVCITLQDDYFSTHNCTFINSTINIQRSRLLERYRSASTFFSNGIFHSSYYRKPKNMKIPQVVTVHDFIYEKFNSGLKKQVHSWQKSASIRSADALICVSNSTKNDLLNYYSDIDENKINVIHNGVSSDFFYTEPNNTISTLPFILFVGQRSSYKNFDLVINSMQFLQDIDLICVGGPPFANSELDLIPPNLRPRVRHLGIVSNATLNILYNTAICLVYPSSYEGFGIPVIEAMRTGCPVVSSNCAAVLEIGKSALFVIEDLDPYLLACEINKILNCNRSDLIKRSLNVSAEYSWEATHEKTVEVYNKLL